MTQPASQRLLLHVGSPGRAWSIALAGLLAAAGFAAVAGPDARIGEASLVGAIERALADDDALSADLKPWPAPEHVVRVTAERQGLIDHLSAGDRVTITTGAGKTFVLRLRPAAERAESKDQDARLLLCHGPQAEDAEADPDCLPLELLTPAVNRSKGRTL